VDLMRKPYQLHKHSVSGVNLFAQLGFDLTPPMRYRRHLVLLGLGLIFWPSIAAHSAILLTVKQDGNDVVVIGSGSANTNGLPIPTQELDYTNALWDNQIYAGPDGFSGVLPQFDVNRWGDINGPLSFNTDPFISVTYPTSGSGDLFGLYIDNLTSKPLLVLPLDYVSGNSLNGTSRFDGYTLSDLGLNPGVFSWTWGTTPNTDSLELRIEPVPAPAPLPLAGGAMAWSLAKRMRRASRGQRLHRHFKNPAST
jgi:hypothetical protein